MFRPYTLGLPGSIFHKFSRLIRVYMYFLFTLCELRVSTESAVYVSDISGTFLDITRLPKK
jgi:hypothetical protein